VAPTLVDSTVLGGAAYTTFFVRTLTDSPDVSFDSYPDSGYSVDNLSPNVPTGFTVAYNEDEGNALFWNRCEAEDFWQFRVYRGLSADFTPTPEHLAHVTTDTTWADPVGEGRQYFYKLTAVDLSGNESDPASPETATNGDQDIPEAFALYPNVPNPFNPATTIRFAMPEPGHAVLSVHDPTGRRVAVLADGDFKAGEFVKNWDGRDESGREMGSGIYFARLVAGEYTATRKMVLLK
jgi:hypothetical protein